jgi:hypothetical protein
MLDGGMGVLWVFFFICEINQNKRLSIKIGAKFKILIKNISIARNKNVLAQKKKLYW